MNKHHSKKICIVWIISLLLGICLLSVIDLSIGSSTNATTEIITTLRLPHTLCAIIAGIGLAIVGCILQSTLANPLASASTIGISQGASAGACISIVLFSGVSLGAGLNISTTIIFAFVFAIIPTLIIFLLNKRNNLGTSSIVLCGIAISIFFGGLVAIIEYFADSTKVADVVFWTFGSLRNVTSSGLIIMGAVVIISIIFSWAQSLNLNAYESGEEVAHSVGINIARNRICNLIICAITAGVICAFCGTINFIGLIAPHIMRKLIGANYKYLIPASALLGACLLLLADILTAVIIPGAILPIGAITSLIGAPVFIIVLLRGKHSW